MDSRKRKTFELWEDIFKVNNFDLTQDLHYISAEEIKKFAEPRILAKMDSTKDLPPVFERNGYFLLPVKNGTYAIVRGNGFHILEERGEITTHESRIKFPLTTAGRGMSEMQYLDNAYNTGTIESVGGVGRLYQSIRGREYSKKFNFNVGKLELNTESVQIEVDSGLEGEDSIVLLEAKVNTPEDFIIRQLYYPYRHFRIISPEKKIIPVFFTYEPRTQVYNFWIYEFKNEKDYNSLFLRETKSIKVLTKDELELSDVKPEGVVNYKDLIPQANDLEKVLELVFKVSEGVDNYVDIANHFQFDLRQSSYYREAAEALNLVHSENGKYHLTEVGKKLVSLSTEKRNIFFTNVLLDFTIVKESIATLKQNKILTKQDLENIVAKNSKLGGTTVGRRAGSLASWLKWISSSLGIFTWNNEEGVFEIK